EAIRDFEKSAEIYLQAAKEENTRRFDDKLGDIYNNCGIAYQDLGKLQQGIRNFSQAVALRQHLVEFEGQAQIKPSLAGSLLNLAKAQVKGQEYFAAKQNCARVIELDAGEEYMADAKNISQQLK